MHNRFAICLFSDRKIHIYAGKLLIETVMETDENREEKTLCERAETSLSL